MSARIKSRLLFLLLLMAGTLSLLAVRRASQKPPPPMEVALWYWHQPFRVPPADANILTSAGIKTLFVRAGTFQRDADGPVRLVLPQRWESRADGFAIHLVFRFDSSVVRDFTADAVASALRSIVPRECERAAKAGLHVAGVQFDLDCPTRRLPEYGRLLREARAVCRPPNGVFSVTALPTWFTSREIKQVMEAVDFTVPQYYEADIPRTLDKFVLVGNIKKMERGLQAAGRTGQPFYAGLPAYGHALVYDRDGKLAGPYRDLGIREVARAPQFHWHASFPADAEGKPATPETYTGEDLHDFAIRSATDRGGYGDYLLRFDLPTSVLVERHLARVRENRPANCQGVILFRYPEPGETQTLPLKTLAAVLCGEKATPQIQAKGTVMASPWEAIETGRSSGRLPVELTLRVTNRGTAGSFAAPEAVTVTLYFNRPGIEEIEARAFDNVETFAGKVSSPQKTGPVSVSGETSDSAWLRSSVARANIVRLRKFHLAAGEMAKIGPIRLSADGPTRLWGAWAVRGEGGFETLRGEIPEMRLDRLVGGGQ